MPQQVDLSAHLGEATVSLRERLNATVDEYSVVMGGLLAGALPVGALLSSARGRSAGAPLQESAATEGRRHQNQWERLSRPLCQPRCSWECQARFDSLTRTMNHVASVGSPSFPRRGRGGGILCVRSVFQPPPDPLLGKEGATLSRPPRPRRKLN